MTLPCEDLATKAELQELRDQINALIGQSATNEGETMDVLSLGSLSGTKVEAGLVPDMRICFDENTNTWDICRITADGSEIPFPSAQEGISRIGTTGQANGQIVASGFGITSRFLVDLTNLLGGILQQINIFNLSEGNRTQSQAITELFDWTNLLLDENQDQRDEIRRAEENIDNLESGVAELRARETTLRDSILRQNETIEDLSQSVEVTATNNRVLRGNVEVLQEDLRNFRFLTDTELSRLSSVNDSLQEAINNQASNFDDWREATIRYGNLVAQLQGDNVELSDRLTRGIEGITVVRNELGQLRFEVENDIDSLDSEINSTALQLLQTRIRVRRLEEERRAGNSSGGGVPARTQNDIANGWNSLGSLASSLAGNPTTVTETETGETLTVPTEITYQDILNNNNQWARVFPGLVSLIPDVTNLEGDGVQQADIDAITAGVTGGIDAQLDGALERALAGVGITTSLALIQDQTTPSAQRANVDQAVCDAVETPNGCLRTNLVNPFTNNFNNIISTLGTVGSGVAVGQNTTILGTLNFMQQFAERAWNSTPVQVAMQGFQTALLVHNAAMLSRNLGVTVTETASLVANALPLENFLGENVDFTASANSVITNFVNATIGAENAQQLSTAFANANRVLVAAQGMINSVEGMKNAVLEADEIIGNNIGIGFNALQEQGVLPDNAFLPMNENHDFNSPFNRFSNYLRTTTELTEEIGQLAQSGTEAVQSFQELREQNEEFRTSTQQLADQASQFAAQRQQEITQQEEDSASPEIVDRDLVRAEG